MNSSDLPSLNSEKGVWDTEALSRRKFLEAGVKALTAVAGVGAVAAGAGFLAGKAFDKPVSKWVQVGNVVDLQPGQVHRANFSVRGTDAWRKAELKGVVYVYSEDGDTFTVLDATCTHLGCIVRWQDDDQRFVCPCHSGHFERNGNVISGPAPRALRQLVTKIEEGVLWAEV